MHGKTNETRFREEAGRRYGWLITAWVVMSNHIHLVAETPDLTLSAGMQWLLGTYSQWFNKKHTRSGHLFGDRFHSFLIDKDAYLSEVSWYVDSRSNPKSHAKSYAAREGAPYSIGRLCRGFRGHA